jgi:predicted nucleic acid-binding protein
VDTDIVSFLFKAHSLAPAYQAILAGRSLAVSLITLAEIEYGMEAKNWGTSRRDLMRRFLARFTLLLPDAETARAWARIKRGCEKKGRPISFADAWIAAAAVQLNIPLVTHNASDYTAAEDLMALTVAATP